MEKIKTQKVRMLPKWYFIAGSVLSLTGLIGLSVSAMFFLNLTLFFIRKQGHGYWRINTMLDSFPLWIPLLAISGIFLGIWLLKRFEFSYEKNFVLIAVSFIVAIIISALIIDKIGLNETWSKIGPMRRLYRQTEDQNQIFPQRHYPKRFNIN